MISRIIVFGYGFVAYAGFLVVFLYLIGFLGNFVVPKSIDSGPVASLGKALLINVVLVALIGIQHTVMARPGFKRWLTRLIPRAVERSTYVLVTNLLFLLLFWQWRPLADPVWSVGSAPGRVALWGLFGVGWAVVLWSTLIIDHFDLFGLRQVYLYARGRPYRDPEFQVSALYKYVRHPLLLGWTIAFWATPDMTAGHFLFCVTTTCYILIAIPFEERDLMKHHGDDYERYRRRVSMLIPFPRKGEPPRP